MTVFTGNFDVKLDAKGRFLFPSALLQQAGMESQPVFVIKKDIYEPCLTVYTQAEWQSQVETIRKNLNPFNRQHNIFLREFFKDTAECTLDASNRMVIPKRLVTASGLKSDIAILGLDTKIEIWDQEEYEKSRQKPEDFALLAEKILGNLGNL